MEEASVMIAESFGVFNDTVEALGVLNGFSGLGVVTPNVSFSISSMATPSSDVGTMWCVPTPWTGGRDRLFDHSRLARLATSPSSEVDAVVDVESLAAFRRCFSASSQFLKFCVYMASVGQTVMTACNL